LCLWPLQKRGRPNRRLPCWPLSPSDSRHLSVRSLLPSRLLACGSYNHRIRARPTCQHRRDRMTFAFAFVSFGDILKLISLAWTSSLLILRTSRARKQFSGFCQNLSDATMSLARQDRESSDQEAVYLERLITQLNQINCSYTTLFCSSVSYASALPTNTGPAPASESRLEKAKRIFRIIFWTIHTSHRTQSLLHELMERLESFDEDSTVARVYRTQGFGGVCFLNDSRTASDDWTRSGSKKLSNSKFSRSSMVESFCRS